jgi:hypothetical protein
MERKGMKRTLLVAIALAFSAASATGFGAEQQGAASDTREW